MLINILRLEFVVLFIFLFIISHVVLIIVFFVVICFCCCCCCRFFPVCECSFGLAGEATDNDMACVQHAGYQRQ